MTDSRTISAKDSIKLLTILALLILGALLSNVQFSSLAIYWTLLLLLSGNIRRLSYKNRALYFARMTLYFLPFALPVVFSGGQPISFNTKVFYSCFIVILFFVIWLVFNMKAIRLMLSTELILESTKESRFVLILRIYNLIGAAICEELFFRQYMLTVDERVLIVGILSIVYFVFSHWLLPWGSSFSKKDFLNQALFGSANVLVFIYSHSVIPCMLLHLFLNSINVLKLIRIYDRYYVRQEKYNNLYHSQNYSDLDL